MCETTNRATRALVRRLETGMFLPHRSRKKTDWRPHPRHSRETNSRNAKDVASRKGSVRLNVSLDVSRAASIDSQPTGGAAGIGGGDGGGRGLPSYTWLTCGMPDNGDAAGGRRDATRC